MLGTEELAATAALVNFFYMVSLIGLGIQVTMVAVMGALMAENKSKLAVKFFKVNLLPLLLFFFTFCSLMKIFDDELAYFLSGKSKTAEIEVEAMIYAATFAMVTFINKLVMSPLLTVKSQGYIVFASVIDFYLVGLPLSCILAFNYDMGVSGLFIGGIFGSLVSTMMYLMKLFFTDFEAEAALA